MFNRVKYSNGSPNDQSFFGKYRGKVIDTNDPTSRGRLLVSIPAVLGEITVWAMPCVPYAGDQVGFYSIPPVDSGVWCEFEGGDPSYPIWVGCFWADGQLPDDSDQNIKIWKTKELTVRLDDNASEILIESSDGAKVVITSEVLSDAGGANHTVGGSGVISDSGGNGKVEVTSASVSVNGNALEVI